ncbi:MAG: MFS transporter [Microscillaceae bacterium]|jgi:UMF1 family MFS transporter|nr:MFS transporter [Microscillaceae bacterium]
MKNNPKVIQAWCFYDWANSVHALVIVSMIFPVYYGSVTKSVELGDKVNFFGFLVKNSVLFSYTVSLSFLLVVLLNPFMTAIADYTGRKKDFMRFFVYLGSFSSASLFFFTSETITPSIIIFGLSLVGYSGSIVFYNAYLPEIATEDRFDQVSARGFALGFVGSVILALLNLTMILSPATFGLSDGLAVRYSFLLTGVWWWSFAQYTLAYLPNSDGKSSQKAWLLNGIHELQKVLGELKHQHLLKTFLVAFFFYNMGLMTIMYMAAVFGESELKIPGNSLIITVLLIQILAIFGSYGFAWLSTQYGNTGALRVAVVAFAVICGAAYFINQTGFYVLAAVIGLLMGGIQSLSRSTYAKLMPENTPDRASYFGFYEVMDKLSIVIGTFSFGLIEQLTGSVRNSIVALMLFFIIGLWFLYRVPSRKTYQNLAWVAVKK